MTNNKREACDACGMRIACSSGLMGTGPISLCRMCDKLFYIGWHGLPGDQFLRMYEVSKDCPDVGRRFTELAAADVPLFVDVASYVGTLKEARAYARKGLLDDYEDAGMLAAVKSYTQRTVCDACAPKLTETMLEKLKE